MPRGQYKRKKKITPDLPMPQRPEGAKPLLLRFEVHKDDPLFANISVSGTVLLDHALAIVAMLQRGRE